VDRACALLGHPLELRSDLGCGACFSVTVPLVYSFWSGQDARSLNPHGGARASLEGRIVLLIENDPDLRQAMTLLLRSWGADVVDAANLPEALTQLADLGLSPDAMLVDYELDGGVRGPDVVAQIIARHGPIPARIITGHLSADVRVHCQASDLTVLSKPIDPTQLEAFLMVFER